MPTSDPIALELFPTRSEIIGLPEIVGLPAQARLTLCMPDPNTKFRVPAHPYCTSTCNTYILPNIFEINESDTTEDFAITVINKTLIFRTCQDENTAITCNISHNSGDDHLEVKVKTAKRQKS